MSPKRKLAQFAELKTFPNVREVPYEEVSGSSYALRGKWAASAFENQGPLVLELGCGKGEYTIAMAKQNREKNFIGIDVKGARIWRGAKTALENGIKNSSFLRTKIELIDLFFAVDEIDEIWLTFPDPQPRSSKENKRLTSPHFLRKYASILRKGGLIHLKTDNRGLYDYSLETALSVGLRICTATSSLHADLAALDLPDDEKEILTVQTFYEKKFTAKGHEICYLRLENILK